VTGASGGDAGWGVGGDAAAAGSWWTRHDSGALVFIGGAIGTALRAGLALAVPTASEGFPLATLAVNLIGAFVLGWLVVAVSVRIDDAVLARRVRLGVGTGVCGGFTTFSTFMVEPVLLAEGGAVGVAAGYLALSLVGGFAAAMGGASLGRVGRVGRGRVRPGRDRLGRDAA